MAKSIDFHILFQNGMARQAIERYGEIFDEFDLDRLDLFEADAGELEGQVQVAEFRAFGRRFVCVDSPIQHEWDMTPGIAPFIVCNDDPEMERLFETLSDGGKVHMPLGDYGFGRRFGWVEDRFGVSWLLNIT
ncbi:MAG: VOC family protein [Actinomycetota bacterium]|jgi:predicted 3-demethylubiquinone-9 3-methyltransferase (glyoxalase superfamily)|nr:VOC family protein [Actinomycetota bacterium]